MTSNPKTPPRFPTAPRQADWLYPCLLAAAGLAVYANGLRGPFLFDDRTSILQSRQVIDQLWPLSHFFAGGPRPMLAVSLAVNYALGGLDPLGYHLFNVAVHVLAGLTLYGLIRRTMGGFNAAAAAPVALAAALLWLIHPIQTQAVTYIVQRAESMMALFFLLMLYTLARGAESPRRWAWWAGSIAACVLGMLTKEVMWVAPLVVLLYDRTFLAGTWLGAIRKRWLYHSLLFATLLVPWLLGRPRVWPPSSAAPVAVVASAPAARPAPIYRLEPLTSFASQATGGINAGAVTWRQYFFTQPAVIAHYLKLVFWPDVLVLDYRWPAMATPWSGRGAAGLAIPLAVLVALGVLSIWALWRKPWLGFLGAFFLIVLAPSSSFVPIADLAMEHRMYLPLAAATTLAAVVIWRFLPRTPAVALLVVVAAALAGRTVRRNEDYRSSVAIWSSVATAEPNNARAHLNLGSALYEAGDPAGALAHFQRAATLQPGNSQAYLNIGSIYLNHGDLDEAEKYYAWALRLAPYDAMAHLNVAKLAERRGRLAEAEAQLDEALRQPTVPTGVKAELGVVYRRGGRLNDAAAMFDQALALEPENFTALLNRGQLFALSGRYEEAAELLGRAVGVSPRSAEAWMSLGLARLRLGQWPGARDALERSLSIQRDPRVMWPLAWVFAAADDQALRRGDRAVDLAEKAVSLTPGPTPPLDKAILAAAYAQAGRFELAAQVQRQVVDELLASQAPADEVAQMRRRLVFYEGGKPLPAR